MRFISHFVEAQLHREVYVAVLNGLLRTPGEKRAFAQKVGISPVYLSYLLALDSGASSYPTLRTPSLKVAQRIAQAAPAPADVRESLLLHMTLSNDKRVQSQRLAKQDLDLIRFDGQIKKLRHASEWLQSRVG
jgi:hypothetical protein